MKQVGSAVMGKKVLVVDDEASIRLVLGKYLEKAGYRVECAENGTQAIERSSDGDLSLIILDLNLPDISGIEVFKTIRESGVDTPVIIITAQNTMKNAIDVMKLGAYDYISKPFDLDEVNITARRAIESFDNSKRLELLRESRKEGTRQEGEQQIVGKSPAMLSIFKTIGRIAEKEFPVLITGESGTGKELVARAIHNSSSRRNERLVAVNIAAIPKDLLESELFGYEKGAFTGAVTRKIGRFEEAHLGTLHLDEIGDMPLELQTKLLRVIEEKRFYKLGAERPVDVDVRLIASTNKDLEKEVQRGKFRRDLYYRINTISIEIPPLRVRKDDIPLLAEHFLKKYSKELREGERLISEDGMALLLQYNWPGNVRELENTIKRVLVLSSDTIITREILIKEAPYLTSNVESGIESPEAVVKAVLHKLLDTHNRADGTGLYDSVMQIFEKPLIVEMLTVTKGNKKKASEILGINRNTLAKKIEDLKINVSDESTEND
jgi:two-component system nitrogen regulation response regulator GlnG